MPGDHIRIDDGQVYVNDKPLQEDYVTEHVFGREVAAGTGGAQHSYFVLGDHRSMSNDSRDFGPVNREFIYGKAVFGYWPMEKMGRLTLTAHLNFFLQIHSRELL